LNPFHEVGFGLRGKTKQNLIILKKFSKVELNMSKRKTRAKSMFIDKTDIQFLDDSDDPDIDLLSKPQMKNFINEIKHKPSGSRISARGKKEKKIYDPSDHNGPVHKKKKEALEAAAKKFNTPTKSPMKTPAKSPKIVSLPVKASEKASLLNAKRRLELDNDVELIRQKVQKLAQPVQAVAVAPVKELSSRVQTNKMKEIETLVKQTVAKPVIVVRRSVTKSGSENTASTVPAHEKKAVNKNLDVSTWTPKEVSKFFQDEGFEKKDASEEIDGKALMIMQRRDLERLKMKVGIFIKMWNRILRLQSGALLSLITKF
jgi:hypothetical protein